MKKILSLLIFVCGLSAFAQVGVLPFRNSRATFTDANGVPLANGCLFAYQGGTSTPLATYTDYTGITQNPNPVPLDSTGSAVIWLGPNTYKFVLFSSGGTNCSSGVQQWSEDQIPGDTIINGTISGATITGGTITGAAISGGTMSGTAITNSTVDSTPIGQTTPSSGNFDSLACTLQAVGSTGTPNFAANQYCYFTMTLSQNVTSSTITGGQAGELLTWNICQNGTGQVVDGITTGFTFAWPASFLNPPAINPILNSCTIVTAYSNGSQWTTVSTTPQYLYGNFDQIPYSATPVFIAGNYSNFAITLTGNVTSSTITGGVIGQVITIDVCQNSTGTYTFAWPANLMNAPPVSAAASSCTGVSAVYNGTNWNVISSATASNTTPLTGNLDQIPFTATPTFSTANYSSFTMTLSGNVTSSTLTPGVPGQLIQIALTQGSSTTTGPGSAPTSSTTPTGGSLPASTTYYAVCSWLYGTTESLPSAEATETTGTGGATNTIVWNCPAGGGGVTGYKFYIGTNTGAEQHYFTSSTASYVQISSPSTGAPGEPLGGSVYTVVWPTNLIDPPTMATGIGATTGLIALFDGTNWVVVGTSSGGQVFPTIQHLIATSGLCTASGGSYSTCVTSAQNWPAAFADSGYAVVCSGLNASNSGGSLAGGILSMSKTASQITLTLQTYTSSGFTYGEIDCIGHHN